MGPNRWHVILSGCLLLWRPLLRRAVMQILLKVQACVVAPQPLSVLALLSVGVGLLEVLCLSDFDFAFLCFPALS